MTKVYSDSGLERRYVLRIGGALLATPEEPQATPLQEEGQSAIESVTRERQR